MASWSESSSYQGAASGASAGALTGNPVGIAAGAAIGFVAGGLIGGKQADAAREAEEERQREIQRAIERQNTADFNAKSMAEQWALADIGINKEDQVQDARANTKDLEGNIAAANANVAKIMGSHRGKYGAAITEETWAENKAMYEGYGGAGNKKFIDKVEGARTYAGMAKKDLAINEGIISSYDTTIKPSKY